MKNYTIDPVQRGQLVRVLSVKLAVGFAAILCFVFGLTVVYLTQISTSETVANIVLMFTVATVVCVIVAIRFVQQVKQYDTSLTQLVLSISSDHIKRQQKNAPALSISRKDVTALFETEKGLLVMTRVKDRFMWVPVQLVDYDKAHDILSGWLPVRKMETGSPRNPQVKQPQLLVAAWAVGTAICVGLVLLSADRWQVLASSVLTLGIYLFVYRLMSQQKSINAKFRRTYTGILLFLVVIVVIKLLLTLGR